MPGTPTPNYGWPIPALTDPPDGPAQIGALGNAIDTTLKAQIGSSSSGYTATWAGITLGNYVNSMSYRLIGSHLAIYLEIRAAATAPTTAFLNANCSFTAPAGYTPKSRATGMLYYDAAGIQKIGLLTSLSGNTAITIFAIKQADLACGNPGSVWGTAVWPADARLFGSIIVPL